eukprot:g1376.t1
MNHRGTVGLAASIWGINTQEDRPSVFELVLMEQLDEAFRPAYDFLNEMYALVLLANRYLVEDTHYLDDHLLTRELDMTIICELVWNDFVYALFKDSANYNLMDKYLSSVDSAIKESIEATDELVESHPGGTQVKMDMYNDKKEFVIKRWRRVFKKGADFARSDFSESQINFLFRALHKDAREKSKRENMLFLVEQAMDDGVESITSKWAHAEITSAVKFVGSLEGYDGKKAAKRLVRTAYRMFTLGFEIGCNKKIDDEEVDIMCKIFDKQMSKHIVRDSYDSDEVDDSDY